MMDEINGYIQRVSFVAAKLSADGLQQIPIVGKPIVTGIDKLCSKLAWASDYVKQTSGGTGGPECEGVKMSLNENENPLAPLNTPSVITDSQSQAR